MTACRPSMSSALTPDVPRSSPRYMPSPPVRSACLRTGTSLPRPENLPKTLRGLKAFQHLLIFFSSLEKYSQAGFTVRLASRQFMSRAVARRVNKADSGLSGRASARSALSALASGTSPSRRAASISVRSITSRCAWLPPNACATARIGRSNRTVSA